MQVKTAIVPLLLAGCLSAAAAYAGETLVVVERVTVETTLHRSGGEADGKGDLIVFENAIYDTQNRTKIGDDIGSCLRIVVGKSWTCSWTLQLKDGQIMSQGPLPDSGDALMAVVGGTGKYKGAAGTLAVHQRPGKEVSYDFRYELE
jgi:hypothetical protein